MIRYDGRGEFFHSVSVVLFFASDVHYLHCLGESEHLDSSGRSRISHCSLHIAAQQGPHFHPAIP